MRMRHKPWARPELAAWPAYIQDPEAQRGRWQKAFTKKRPLVLELGCGKGVFAAAASKAIKDRNWLLLDIKSEVLAEAKRNIEKSFAKRKGLPGHVRMTAWDIARISMILSPGDVVSAIYILFPNPWPKDRHKKRRLTHTRQLLQYRAFLEDGGLIYFKTDDSDLFEESLGYFAESGYYIRFLTRDLAHSPFRLLDAVSEFEQRFSTEGKPISMLVAEKVPLEMPSAPTTGDTGEQGERRAQGAGAEL